MGTRMITNLCIATYGLGEALSRYAIEEIERGHLENEFSEVILFESFNAARAWLSQLSHTTDYIRQAQHRCEEIRKIRKIRGLIKKDLRLDLRKI